MSLRKIAFFHEFVTRTLGSKCCKIKTPKQYWGSTWGEKSKTASVWFYLYITVKWLFCIKESQNKVCPRAVSFHLIFLCTAWIKDMYHYYLVSIANSLASGIKCECHHSLVCKYDQWDYFILWSSGKLYLLKEKSNHYSSSVGRVHAWKEFYMWNTMKI